MSVGAIIFTAIAVLVSFMAWGLSFTFQFVEKTDIQEKKVNIESKLFNELRENFQEIHEKLESLSNERFQAEMWRFGQDSVTCSLPSKILSKISWNYSTMIKKLGALIIGVILIITFVVYYFKLIIFPLEGSIIIELIGVIGALFLVTNYGIYKIGKNTIILRNTFNQLSKNTTLKKIKEIENNLKNNKVL